MSISQLLIDSHLGGDWSGVTGNFAKLGLGNVSIMFDIIFMVQHYALYRRPKQQPEIDSDDEADAARGERRRLLE